MLYPQAKIFLLLVLFSQLTHPVNLNLNDNSTANRTKIIRTFAPELRLDSREEHFPSSVQWYWKRSSLRYWVDGPGDILAKSAQLNARLLGTYNKENFPNTDFTLWPNQPALKGELPINKQVFSPCYAHMKKIDDGAIIQYLFFFPYNQHKLLSRLKLAGIKAQNIAK